MLVTALAPVIGYDKASKIAHFAMDHDLTLKAAALQLGFVVGRASRTRSSKAFPNPDPRPKSPQNAAIRPK